jgi:hypothetical protein
MKKHFRQLVALALFAVALTGAALAQEGSHTVRANIPFSFYAGGRTLPAGEYTISVNLENRLVLIRQKATGSGILLLGGPDDGSRNDRSVLTFKLVDGEVYALRELQEPGIGVTFNSKTSQSNLRVQNREDKSVTLIAEAR